jgi:ubiquinol-cytochrome c reductase iron-sulfur subunit
MSAYKKPPTPYGESDVGNRTYAYWMVGGMASLGALAGKNIVTDYLVHFAASADVLALATVEVELASIPVGKNIILKWRGKPVTIRHRSVGEIEEANGVAMSELRHQELDSDRTQNPEWLVMLAVCTHLGCVPIGEGMLF